MVIIICLLISRQNAALYKAKIIQHLLGNELLVSVKVPVQHTLKKNYYQLNDYLWKRKVVCVVEQRQQPMFSDFNLTD